jgi:hypothetical protein
VKPDFKEITSGLAVAHLYRRFQAPEFFGVHEVAIVGSDERDHFGVARERRADFIAVRMWGNARTGPAMGFEIKTTRQDFMNELKDPTKRAPMEELCNACYFVAPSKIFDPSELPAGWGWLEIQRKGLRMKREAQFRKGPPSPLFLHAVMKRMLDDRWHKGARRPAVLDFPQRIWELESKALTSGQLHSLMLETFFKESEAIQARAKQEAKEELREEYEDKLKRLKAFESMAANELGLWRAERESVDQIQEILRKKIAGGAASESIRRALADAIRDQDHFRKRLDMILNDIKPEPEIPLEKSFA